MMYLTSSAGDAILWADMDGSGSAVLVLGLNWPIGITIDYDSSRLCWVELGSHKIQSSALKGEDLRTIVVDLDAAPFGIATMRNRVYWSTENPDKVHSVNKAGEDVRTLYHGANNIKLLILPTSNLPRNRQNHCEYTKCTRICVLTATFARCII